jgi:hypothetical protein
MAPKAKPKGKPKSEASAGEQDDPLYAIVLADSYESRMSPFSLELPRVFGINLFMLVLMALVSHALCEYASHRVYNDLAF